MHLADAPVQHLDRDVGDEAGADAVRDRVGQRHQDHGEERRDRGVEPRDVDASDVAAHQQARSGSAPAPWPPPAPPTPAAPAASRPGTAGRRTPSAGRCGRLRRRRPPTRCRTVAELAPRRRRSIAATGVDRQHLLQARHHAVLAGQARGVADRGDRADRVEEVDEHQREQQRRQPPVERGAHVGLEQRVEARPGDDGAVPRHVARLHRQQRRHGDRRAASRRRGRAPAGTAPATTPTTGDERLGRGPVAARSPAAASGRVLRQRRHRRRRARRRCCAWTRPRKTMNRPMPAPMARRRSTGMARTTASRMPSSTSSEHDERRRGRPAPSPPASCPAAGADLEGDHGVQAHARRQRDRHVGAEPHQDRGAGRRSAPSPRPPRRPARPPPTGSTGWRPGCRPSSGTSPAPPRASRPTVVPRPARSKKVASLRLRRGGA